MAEFLSLCRGLALSVLFSVANLGCFACCSWCWVCVCWNICWSFCWSLCWSSCWNCHFRSTSLSKAQHRAEELSWGKRWRNWSRKFLLLWVKCFVSLFAASAEQDAKWRKNNVTLVQHVCMRAGFEPNHLAKQKIDGWTINIQVFFDIITAFSIPENCTLSCQLMLVTWVSEGLTLMN